MSKHMEDCGVSVNLTQVPNSTTPLHIVLWKGADESRLQVQSLLDRITTLESMVAGLLESQKASVWFPPCLRPTPAGLDIVSRRESAGNESDFGSLLSNIVRPTAERVAADVASEAEVEDDAEVAEVEAEAEEAEVDAEAEQAEVDAEAEVEAEAEAEAEAEEAEAEVEEAEAEVEEAEAEVEEAEVEEADDEDDIVEYKEIEWKGRTYYVDSENQAYEMDTDGDLIDTPIGVWREETKKLLKYAK